MKPNAFLVWHEHELAGEHDPRCVELRPDQVPADAPYHVRHEGNELIVSEAGVDTKYAPEQWSAAGPDLACGYGAGGPADCPRCTHAPPAALYERAVDPASA